MEDHARIHDGVRTRLSLVTLTVVAVTAATACARVQTPPSPPCDHEARAVPLSAARRDSLRPSGPGAYVTIDERSAEIARRAPGGYAGIYREGGHTVILLADTSDVAATLSAVLPMVAVAYGGRDIQASAVRIRKVRWNFAELYDWGRYLDGHVWPAGGVTMRDLDEVRNRVSYGVESDAARHRIESRLAGLGIPCGLVVVQVSPGIEIR